MLQWAFRSRRDDPAGLSLWERLRRLALRDAAQRNPQALVEAMERCAACRNSAKCEQLLASRQEDKVDALCPNVMYLAYLQAMERHAPKKDLL
jgi:hypothetical protein